MIRNNRNRIGIPPLIETVGDDSRTTKSRRRGQALVEMALTVTILLGLSLMLIQYGIILNTTITLSNLSREAARYAAVNPQADAPIYTHIQDATTGTLVKWADITNITITPAQGNAARVSGNTITVSLTYNLAKKRFLPGTFMGIKVFSSTFTTAATMRIE